MTINITLPRFTAEGMFVFGVVVVVGISLLRRRR